MSRSAAVTVIVMLLCGPVWVSAQQGGQHTPQAPTRPDAEENDTKDYRPFPPPDSGYVTDLAGLLSPEEEERIERWLWQVESRTGVEIAVVTIGSITDYPGAPVDSIEAFARGLFDTYGIGNMPRSDRVLMLVAREDRKVRIQLGTAYAHRRDADARRVVNETIVPAFKTDRYAEGVTKGVKAPHLGIRRPACRLQLDAHWHGGGRSCDRLDRIQPLQERQEGLGMDLRGFADRTAVRSYSDDLEHNQAPAEDPQQLLDRRRIRWRVRRRVLRGWRCNRKLVEEIDVHCPKCRTEELSTRRSKDSDVAVDWCAECRGVWFDAGELAAALTVATKDLTVPRKAQKIGLLCPKCEKSLYSFHYPQTLVTIDMCKKCKGLWLNSGEFKEIKAVRRSLKRQGAVEEYAPVGGVKGSFLRYIDQVLGTIGTR